MNKLYVGFSKSIELPKGGCLSISDDVPDVPRARVFDPLKHSFNPLKGIDHRKAREIAEVLYTIAPEGESTLTVRNGKRALMRALLSAKTLDTVRGDEEVNAMISELMFSPVLKRVLCQPTNFSFNPKSTIIAKLDRAELGDYDSLVIAFFLMVHFKGQVVVNDFGFYGRDAHAALIREKRLIAGLNFLGELAPRLCNSVLVIEDKVASGATVEDAETIARYKRLRPGTNAFNDFVDAAMA